jgi:hypothetical protein
MGGTPDRLAVDLTGLEDFARTLQAARTTMNGTRKLFDSYEARLGSDKGSGALDHFEHNRQRTTGGLDRLAPLLTGWAGTTAPGCKAGQARPTGVSAILAFQGPSAIGGRCRPAER